jgi:hypothetical protein
VKRPVRQKIILPGVRAQNGKYSVNGILQSIFRSATRRETLGSRSEGGRRGGELKIDWTKPLAERGLCVLIAGWISGEDLKGPQAVSVGNRRDGSRRV